ncbi:MAG: LysE family translocator [Pseudomonadota bacterium]
MIPFDVALVFIAAASALAAVPGPDNLFVLMQSALNGRLAGFIVTLGLASGLIVHTTAAAFGAAVLFQTSALAFNALKIIGALYLLYLAWGALRSQPQQLSGNGDLKIAAHRLFLRGLIMNVANPKVTLFILAFLPQFVDPGQGSLIAQFYQLGGLFFLVTLCVFGTIAIAAGSLGTWLNRSPGAQILLNRFAGLVFVALALRLATAQR